MPALRKCPWCGGAHRKKSTARKCAKRNIAPKSWTKKEVGL